MAEFFDEALAQSAIRNRIIQALEQLADDSGLRDHALRRFDRDEPPLYESSTETDEDILLPKISIDVVLDEFKDVMDAPLTASEQGWAPMHILERIYDPAYRYRIEASIEEARVKSVAYRVLPNGDSKKRLYFFPRGTGDERLKIVVRRNIKRRWQKLGIWNPQWGIPGRQTNPGPNDDPGTWKWRWQDNGESYYHHIKRALRLRQDLHRHEDSLEPPHTCLQYDASASQAESFIISRPWFRYHIEHAEESARFDRVPLKIRCRTSQQFNLQKLWELRGDCSEAWKDHLGNLRLGGNGGMRARVRNPNT